MSSHIVYNTDLALYSHEECLNEMHVPDECLPEKLELGKTYPFLKVGHRNYEINGRVTLLMIKPNEVLFTMRAEVEIVESFFVIENSCSYTRGHYTVLQFLSE